MTLPKTPRPSVELRALEAEIKALPPGAEFEFIVSREGAFIRGGKYGKAWTRWEPKKA